LRASELVDCTLQVGTAIHLSDKENF
jgi:hypothetical protein